MIKKMLLLFRRPIIIKSKCLMAEDLRVEEEIRLTKQLGRKVVILKTPLEFCEILKYE